MRTFMEFLTLKELSGLDNAVNNSGGITLSQFGDDTKTSIDMGAKVVAEKHPHALIRLMKSLSNKDEEVKELLRRIESGHKPPKDQSQEDDDRDDMDVVMPSASDSSDGGGEEGGGGE